MFRKPDPTQDRVIHILQPNDQFASNSVTTTKYNILSWLPKSLLDQFRRSANIYFLFISVFMMIPAFESPLGPLSTITPLTFVMLVTSLKEGLEDIKRYQSDQRTNKQVTQVICQDGTIQEVQWRNIKVGDIVRVENCKEIPADLILLTSSEEQGICYVETSNIDGETNLKMRLALPQTVQWNNVDDISKLRGILTCEQPNRNIHSFKGSITLDSPISTKACAIDANNFLLRGSSLKNTHFIYGLVVFTGPESKIMKNSQKPRSKLSRIEKMVNKCIRLIFFTQLLLCAASTIGLRVWNNIHPIYEYLGGEREYKSDFLPTWIIDMIMFLILYNNFVPISLYVTMEMVNFQQASFIRDDLDMYDNESKTPAGARTSNLNEDLGMLDYIFSDKTGTLTRNVMEFKRCSVGGILYGHGEDEEPIDDGTQYHPDDTLHDSRFKNNYVNNHPTKSDIEKFMEILSVCHTVVPDTEDGELVYRAESPDEGALVRASRGLGFTFVGRTASSVSVQVQDESNPRIYEILAVNQFDSTRKRMSVVVRSQDKRIYLFCKGADNVIFDRSKQEETRKLLMDHLFLCASEGLRTLVLAYRELDNHEFSVWEEEYQKALNSESSLRDNRLAVVAEQLEVNLNVVGATAIEDKLQEGVPETIESFRRAGINTWVLTGDKVETAINIGYSCKLLVEGCKILRIETSDNGSDDEEVKKLRGQLEGLQKKFKTLNQQSFLSRVVNKIGLHRLSRKFSGSQIEPITKIQSDFLSLIVTGPALVYILADDAMKNALLEIAMICRAVIACRVSPAQKALLVRMVKLGIKPKPVTLAIGDGANDVGMIQEAHVGIGISGKEGMQAVNSSDYSIAQFRFLKRLLLVHGRWSYRRASKVFLYSFYKNVALTVTLFMFNYFTGHSGQSLYESMIYSAFNFFLGWPIICVGVFDRDVSEEVAMAYPELYISGRMNLNLNIQKMAEWILNAVVHAVIVFAVPRKMFFTFWDPEGRVDGLAVLGMTTYTCLIFTMQFKLAIETNTWTIWNHFFFWGSFAFFFVVVIAYGNMPTYSPEFFGVHTEMFNKNVFWFLLLFVPVLCMITDTVVETIRRELAPTPIDYAIEFDRSLPLDREERKKRLDMLQQEREEQSEREKQLEKSIQEEDSLQETTSTTPRTPQSKQTIDPETPVRPVSLTKAGTKRKVRPESRRNTIGELSIGLDDLNELFSQNNEQDLLQMGLVDTATPSGVRNVTGFAFSHAQWDFGPGAGVASIDPYFLSGSPLRTQSDNAIPQFQRSYSNMARSFVSRNSVGTRDRLRLGDEELDSELRAPLDSPRSEGHGNPLQRYQLPRSASRIMIQTRATALEEKLEDSGLGIVRESISSSRSLD